ncbi:hypothetical protein Aperf_G00000088529 [Anoplocephala perfoliata]
MAHIVKFLVMKSIDVMVVRIPGAVVVLRAIMEEHNNEETCLFSETDRFFHCNFRSGRVTIDAHIISQHFHLVNSTIKTRFVVQHMNTTLESQLENGKISIQKANAVLERFEEVNMAPDINRTELLDYMNNIFSHFLPTMSCNVTLADGMQT